MKKREKFNGKHVIIAARDSAVLKKHADILEAAGFTISACVETIKALKTQALSAPCDLIVACIKLSDGHSTDALLEIAETHAKPSIIVADEDDREDLEKALQDHVMAYLESPVRAEELENSAYLVLCRFEQFQDLKKENAKLKDQLETRKKLERAKGIIMVKYKFTEEDAYLKIRSLATSKRMSISNVCDFLIKSLPAD